MKPHSEPVRRDLIVPKKNSQYWSPKRVGNRNTIKQEVKDWLGTMIQNHWYLHECKKTGGLFISFCNHNDAMRFKLAWH